ncbi:MAG TPA: hypothetical protein VK152_04065, partial [Paludibacter sp.]|nr:hypothetical protein [Paludibacter sp.]
KYGNVGGTVGGSGSYPTFTTLKKLAKSNHILLYRLGLVYLRYAEAVNRAGYPGTAFAVLKYGLSPLSLDTLNYTDRIPLAEIGAEAPFITIFNKDKYVLAGGIHARGCGATEFATNYKIGGSAGNLATKQDSITWVEEAICNELALETSFEGNRFGDLVRIASRRNDLDFLARRIAAKNGNDSRIYGLLSTDKKNWFLPEYRQ